MKYENRRPRIIVTEPDYFTPASLVRMRKFGTVVAKRMARQELLRAVADADVLVVRIETKIDKELLARAHRLRCVVSATTGLNHIDVNALAARKIRLFSLHGSHSVPTAEHALALLFAAARNIVPADAHVKKGKWSRWEYIGSELAGKTLGIFGIGRIGTEVAMRGNALLMNVIAYDPYVTAKEMTRRGVKKVPFAALLAQSDFVSLHAPLTKETDHAFGAKEFARMKPSSIIVNTARGDIIDNRTLIAALRGGRIRAAAIDVYAEEPLPRASILRDHAKRHRNLILTPHIAASTREAVERASNFSADAIEEFFS